MANQHDENKDRLWTLHRLMLESCIERLQNGEPARGSTLKEIRGFLADNGITLENLRDEGAMTELDRMAQSLPRLDFDGDGDGDGDDLRTPTARFDDDDNLVRH